MRQAIVVGLGERAHALLQKGFNQLAAASASKLLLMPGMPAEKKPRFVQMELSEEDVQQHYYDPRVRAWSAANWGKWGAALLDSRFYGKLAAYHHLWTIYKEVERLDEELSKTSRLPVPLDLYLVVNLSEPFASGAMLDIAYLLDHYASHKREATRSIRVYGLLILPATDEEQNRKKQTQAVSYAALRELAFVQSGTSFYENHHPMPNLDMKHENHSPFESGGCFVIGGELSENALSKQISQWIRICTVTSIGDQIANRIHLRSTAVVSTFSLQEISDTTRPIEAVSRPPNEQERAQRLAALRALQGEDTRLDDERRKQLESALRLPLINYAGLQEMLRSDQPAKSETPVSEDTEFQTKANRLIWRETDLVTDLEKDHEKTLQKVWQILADADGEVSKITSFEDLLRQGGTLEQCDRECRFVFEAVEERHKLAVQRSSDAKQAASTAASELLQARAAAAELSYTRTEQSVWNPAGDQFGLWVLAFLLILLFDLVFLALGLVPPIPILTLVSVLLIWIYRHHQRRSASEAKAVWRQAQDDFLNAQVNLLTARHEERAIQKLLGVFEQTFEVTREDGETGPLRWRADELRQRLFNPLLERYRFETALVLEPVDWTSYRKDLWKALLKDTDLNTATKELEGFVYTKSNRPAEHERQDAISLRQAIEFAVETAAYEPYLDKTNMLGDERTNIDELIGLPPNYEDFLSGTSDNLFFQLDNRDIAVYLDNLFSSDNLGRILIRLHPQIGIHAISGIKDWGGEYRLLLKHDNYDGSATLITRAQLHLTRTGIVSPNPEMIIPPPAEHFGGYSYSIAVLLLAILLRQSRNKELWLEWAMQLGVDARSHNLDWLNFDELCGAMQEQPSTLQRLLQDLLESAPATPSEEDEKDLKAMLSIAPLVSETYADWEVWAVRQMRKAFSRDGKYNVEHRQWLTRCWVGLRPTLTSPKSETETPVSSARNVPARFQNADPMRIGIWGTPQVGKTTYLLMLLRALEQTSSNWSVDAVDDASYQFWKLNQARLEIEGLFPEKTVNTIDYGYWIGYKDGDKTEALFELSITDTAGELYAEFYAETQRDKKVKVRQRLTESLDSDLTPREIFNKLLECEGIIILVDPTSKESGATPLGQMLRDLLYEIRNAKRGEKQTMPFVALCLTKIDGENDLWDHKEAQPKEGHCTRGTKGTCEDCMVFEQLGADFMNNAQKNLYPSNYVDYVRCFAISSIGRSTAQGSQEAKTNVSTNQKWRRPFTPIYKPDPTHIATNNPALAQTLNTYADNEIPLPNPDEPTTRRQFMPTAINDYQALEPYNVDKPLAWLYKRISEKRSESGQPPSDK